MNQENEIWKRVHGESPPLYAQDALLPEKLADWIMAEQADSEYCRLLAGRLQGADAAAVRRISAEEENHARELNTLYYVLTQRSTRRKCPAAVIPPELCQAFRERYFSELDGARGYQAAAAENPSHQELFSRLAQDEQRHAALMLSLLSRNLRW